MATAKKKVKVITAEEGCSCCAEVISKNPLRYRYVNRLVVLKNSTLHKKIKIVGCPECDEPMIANAKRRAGKEIDG